MNDLETLERMFTSSNDLFKKHIDYIRFPFYKNYMRNLKVNFDFPITFITGTNGTGKSSLLHALYGSPFGNSISEFWFNTALDPINDLDDNRHCFICGFRTLYTRSKAEILKTRIRRTDTETGVIDLDYWEPARPSKQYGMFFENKNNVLDNKEATKTRWKLQEKKVYYMDFRYSLSAFDKYFYFGSRPNGKTIKSKQDLIRFHSKRLKTSFEEDIEQRYYNSYSTVPERFSEEAILTISNILDKNYSEAKILQHNFFDKEKGFAIRYKADEMSYSEAFAGSGEIAIAKLISDLLNVEKYSLILLDEPETSLHPTAQKKLMAFIMKQIIKKKLQVVISTHSPDIIENMPSSSIKVFYENPVNKKIDLHENIHFSNAFVYIGRSLDKQKLIIVEDKLAKMIVNKVLAITGNQKHFLVEFSPGGESTIKQENMVVYSKTSDKDRFILFDGDQRVEKIDINDLPNSERKVEKLRELVKKIVGQKITFNFDSGKNHNDQEVDLLEKYISYHNSNVFFLPKQIPEEIIWVDEYAKNLVGNAAYQLIATETDLKKRFNKIAEALYDDCSATSQLKVYELFVSRWSKNSNSDDFVEIKRIIDSLK